MSDCCRRALRGPPESGPSLPFNPFADFREHSPPKLEAREETVVRHASDVHLQIAQRFRPRRREHRGHDESLVSWKDVARPAFASATQANGERGTNIARHGSTARCGCSPAAQSGRGWCPACAASPYGFTGLGRGLSITRKAVRGHGGGHSHPGVRAFAFTFGP